MLCMSSIVGTNAHRTTLRHVNTSYKLLFGAPLVFTTPNFADTRSVILSLLYEGASIDRWSLLHQDSPQMPSAEEMMRRVAHAALREREISTKVYRDVESEQARIHDTDACSIM